MREAWDQLHWLYFMPGLLQKLSRPHTGKSSLVPKPASPCSVCPLVCDAVLSFVATKGQREGYREIILTLRLFRLEPCVVRPTQTLDILVRRIV